MEMIKITNLTKSYITSKSPVKKLGEALRADKNGEERFTALDNISLSVSKGEAVGIIGRNGSGKSTLLKLLAGITSPDSGVCEIRGSVSAILELGAGFNPEYSGIENIYLNGALNGLDKNAVSAQLADVLNFAEIGRDFAAMPVRTYSSGMLVRLAFACAIMTDADIFLVDEALAVGDIRFRAKCFKKFEELKAADKTILFVSHDADAVRRFCNRAIWLDSGRIISDGEVGLVTSQYIESCVSNGAASAAEGRHYGYNMGCIRSVEVSQPEYRLGDEVRVTITADISKDANPETCGVCLSVKDMYGLDLCVFRTEELLPRGLCTVEFRFANRLGAGEYLLAAGVEERATTPISYHEYTENAAQIVSLPDNSQVEKFGLAVIPCEITIKRSDRNS